MDDDLTIICTDFKRAGLLEEDEEISIQKLGEHSRVGNVFRVKVKGKAYIHKSNKPMPDTKFGSSMRSVQRLEVLTYNQLLPKLTELHIPPCWPRAYFAAWDSEKKRAVLIFDDLTTHGLEMVGVGKCPHQVMRQIVHFLGVLHSMTWGRGEAEMALLRGASAVERNSKAFMGKQFFNNLPAMAARLRELRTSTCDEYARLVTVLHTQGLEFAEAVWLFGHPLDAPLVHGDAHTENIMASADGSKVALLDWAPAPQLGTNDLVSALAFGLHPEEYPKHWRSLLAEYERVLGHRVDHIHYLGSIIFTVMRLASAIEIAVGLKPEWFTCMAAVIDYHGVDTFLPVIEEIRRREGIRAKM